MEKSGEKWTKMEKNAPFFYSFYSWRGGFFFKHKFIKIKNNNGYKNISKSSHPSKIKKIKIISVKKLFVVYKSNKNILRATQEQL